MEKGTMHFYKKNNVYVYTDSEGREHILDGRIGLETAMWIQDIENIFKQDCNHDWPWVRNIDGVNNWYENQPKEFKDYSSKHGGYLSPRENTDGSRYVCSKCNEIREVY